MKGYADRPEPESTITAILATLTYLAVVLGTLLLI